MSRSFVVTLAAIAALTGSVLLVQAHAAPPAAQAPASQAVNSGKVVQFLNGGGYTYAEVEIAGGQKIWVAGSQLDVKKGSEVRWGNAMMMRDFESKTLKRRFGEVLFVDGWGVAGKASVATAQHGTYPMPKLNAQAPAAPAGAAETGVVKSVTNAGGYSYVEVDRGNRTIWVAAMETKLKKGDKVRWEGGTEMSNFTAKSINRTFEKITFAQTLSVTK